MNKEIEEMAKYCPFYEEGKCLLLEEDAEECDMNCDMCTFVNALYNAGYRNPEWISVEERLPDIDTHGKGRYGGVRSVRVLCACKQRDGRTFVKEGYYEPCASGMVVWRIPGSIDSVTHWMPLPMPPKGDEGK